MKIKKIDTNKEVTDEQLREYRSLREYSTDGIIGWTALDVGLELPIVTIDFGGERERIDLVNPDIVEASKDVLVYLELDHEKEGKVRRTIRRPFIKVETSNIGTVIFEANKTQWKNQDELMSDEGLFECVTAQRLIDAINGVAPNDPIRRYNPQVKTDKIGRNERVMIQSPDGETSFLKYKHAEPLIEQGYQLV